MKRDQHSTHDSEAHGFNPWASQALRHVSARRGGVALILVLVALTIATILSMSFLASQATTHGVSQNVQNHAQARSVAESALVAAINYVQTDPDFRTDKTEGQWASNVSFDGGTFDLYGYDGLDTDGDGVVDDTDGDLADDTSDPVTLVAIGYYNGVSHRVSAAVTPGSGQPALNVLMVVGDAGSLNTHDQDLIDLMEGWGMNVTYLSDSASQAEYNAAAALADVVYVAESSNSSDVNTKTTNFTIGVVTDESYLCDDLGLSSSGGSSFTDNQIDIVDNSHYITSFIDSGDMNDLAYTTSSQGMYYVNGTLGAGVDVLATRDSDSSPTIVAVDVGGALADSSTARGRRVYLPTGGGFDITALTSTGEQILERSLEWAGAASGVSTSGLLAEYFIPPSDPHSLSEVNWTDTPDYTETVSQINYSATNGSLYVGGPVDHFGVRYTGTIDIPTDGTWTFYLESDDGSDLSIDGTGLIDNDGQHAMTERSGSVYLTAGSHTLQARLFENGGDVGIILSWSGPSVSKQVIPADVFGASGSDSTDTTPNLVALYEFNETPTPEPAMVAHWSLDDTGGGSVGFSVALNHQLIMYSSSKIDSYSSSQGAYGGANVGSSAYVSTNSTASNHVQFYDTTEVAGDFDVGPGGDPSTVILSYSSNGVTGSTGSLSSAVSFPSLSAPTGMPASSGYLTYNSGNHVISADATYDSLTLNNGSTITISGNVKLHIIGDMTLNGGQVLLDTGASLELHVGGTTVIYNNSAINPDSSRSSDLTFYMYGSGKNLTMTNTSEISGLVYVPYDLTLNGDAKIDGAIIVGHNITMTDATAIHVDTDLAGGALVASDAVAGNNGSDNGGVTPGVTGHGDGGTAMRFDGSDDYLAIAHDDSYLLDSGAVSLWFKADDTNGHQAIFSKDSMNYDTGGHLHIYLDGSRLKARIQSTSASYEVQSSTLSAGNWYHALVSWGSAGLKLYVDGAQQDSDSYTGGLGTTSGGSGNHEPIAIGAGTWTSDDLQITPITYPFDGVIDDVRIYDNGMNEAQADNLYHDLDPGPGYSSVCYDTSGYDTALDLNIEDVTKVTWVDGWGLTIDSPTRISSASSATKLYNALTATDAFSVEVIFTPDNLSQSGPARIVTYSANSTSRNFTVGQDSDAYIARVRTSSTTSNGTPDVSSSAVLGAGTQQHVIVSYDGENVTLYRNGATDTTVARTGTLNWDSAYRLAFGDELDGGRSWLGTLSRVAIYDRAFNTTQANNVFNGQDPGDGTAADGPGSIDWIEP